MNILFLTDSFNGMAQRLWLELDRKNHQVHVQIAVSSNSMIQAVEKYVPDLIIAPYLTKKIPEEIWKKNVCLIVHPGIIGDRGASSLDWAILNEEEEWGVTILQAVDKMDAGPVWATHHFKMRSASKAELYRNEVAQAASRGILEAIEKFEHGKFHATIPEIDDQSVRGRWKKRATQEHYRFSWEDNAHEIVRKIRAADSTPGVLISLYDRSFYCYGAHPETNLKGRPGYVLSHRHGAICIAAGKDSVWLTHLKAAEKESIKLPAVMSLGNLATDIPMSKLTPFDAVSGVTWQEIRFEQDDEIGYLHFDFYNGAMSTEQCTRLRKAFIEAKKRVKLIVMMGGRDVWSNGIHLNVIENAAKPADESWANINAMDDLIREIILSTNHYIVCALQGNAGAGGVPLSLSGDKLLARDGVVLNPHTKNMGLYGSEYWTFLLPKRIGIDKAKKFTEECLPWGMAVAHEIGLIDHFYGQTNGEFVDFVKAKAKSIIELSYFDKLLKAKQFQRRKDEMNKPLEQYRKEELANMKANFYENNKDYDEKRHRFIHKIPNENSSGIEDLYSSRRSIYRKRKWESIVYNNR